MDGLGNNEEKETQAHEEKHHKVRRAEELFLAATAWALRS